jgi:hypothetical protein
MQYLFKTGSEFTRLDGVQVFDLLREANDDFVPSLNKMDSPTTKNLNKRYSTESIPKRFYNGLLKEHFILAYSAPRTVVGFIAYILDEEQHFCYMTIAIVRDDWRNQEVFRTMYFKLALKVNCDMGFQTWSTNHKTNTWAQKEGYNIIQCIPHDRGGQVDSLYYLKTKGQKLKNTMIGDGVVDTAEEMQQVAEKKEQEVISENVEASNIFDEQIADAEKSEETKKEPIVAQEYVKEDIDYDNISQLTHKLRMLKADVDYREKEDAKNKEKPLAE